jgi:hypothetical protein
VYIRCDVRLHYRFDMNCRYVVIREYPDYEKVQDPVPQTPKLHLYDVCKLQEIRYRCRLLDIPDSLGDFLDFIIDS